MSGDRPDVTLIDGKPADTLSILDRGLHYGDGLFETIPCRRGRTRFLSWHLERLISGCARLRIHFDFVEALSREIRQLAAGRESALIKVLVTRGTATGRGYVARGDESATRIVLRYSWPQEDPAWWRDGIVARIANQRLGENPALAGLKHLNRLEQVLGRSEPENSDVHEALMLSSSGWLVSGTMSNVFIVRGNVLRTPRIDLCGVAGVMRRAVMQEALHAGIAREECFLIADDLSRADEIFVTNARIGIWPVRRLGARELIPGPITRRLQQLIQPLLEEPPDERGEADTGAEGARGAVESDENGGSDRDKKPGGRAWRGSSIRDDATAEAAHDPTSGGTGAAERGDAALTARGTRAQGDASSTNRFSGTGSEGADLTGHPVHTEQEPSRYTEEACSLASRADRFVRPGAARDDGAGDADRSDRRGGPDNRAAAAAEARKREPDG